MYASRIFSGCAGVLELGGRFECLGTPENVGRELTVRIRDATPWTRLAFRRWYSCDGDLMQLFLGRGEGVPDA